jgi:prepilin-type N-terminal cleavage/methylation domain-containing protein/prepilin-type processing-associated H-X9-DG protein
MASGFVISQFSVFEEFGMLRSRRARSAFTLIELLVVIAIIAILIGLLVPAVQKVRAAAARAQCQNNLKQIGLGCHMYQDSYKRLPAGWVVNPASGGNPNPGWSWSLLILPYIEQGPLYTTIAAPLTAYTVAPATNATLQSVIPTYLCPSDNPQPFNTLFSNYGFSNYVCNREVLGPNASNLPAAMTVQGIQDGSSNTILIGERDITWNVAAVWGVRSSVSSCSFEGRPGSSLSPQPASGSTWGTGSAQRLAFSSQHTGGCNFVFADGSVHFVNNGVDADPADVWTNYPALFTNHTLQNLIHPNDGNPTNFSDS